MFIEKKPSAKKRIYGIPKTQQEILD